MFRSLTILAALLCVALSPTGCALCGRSVVTVSEPDRGETVRMRVGDTLEVVLEENATTGYLWELMSDNEPVLKQVGEKELRSDFNLLGSAGRMTKRFRAEAAGKTVLRLVYRRPFEKDAAPARTFEATVAVEP